MNYTELKKAIRGYVENDFPTITFSDSVTTFTSDEQLATFVKQAEQRIYNSMQFPLVRKSVIGVFDADNPYLTCPSDFLSPYSLAVINLTTGRRDFLLNKDVEFIREAYPIPTSTGRPRHYALFGPMVNGATITTDISIIVGPTPDLNYQAELHYYYYPESIVTAGTTWLGDNFDTVLLYGALQEGYTFIKAEQDMLVRIDTQYKEALSLAKRLADGLERQDAYRSGQVRYPVP
ncbi:MAG: hypothetical protein EBR82_65875 [Caulobacteraceae bacterium]|nr:hypothetical protein [Caulobacteraceae bacterium]